jgi:hypothetical protein
MPETQRGIRLFLSFLSAFVGNFPPPLSAIPEI